MSLGAVLICKEYSEPYRDAFSRRDFTPYFIPVLETRLVNQDLLKQTIYAGPGTRYQGVIITSSRAANAWVSCVKDSTEEIHDTAVNWGLIPFYVVGKATESAIRACDELLPAPLEVVGADKAGTGEKLAYLIVESYKGHDNSDEEQQGGPNFLYLTGDKNRETIPDVLIKAGFRYHKMQVYETAAASDLTTRLTEAIHSIQQGTNTKLWATLFSPSTASYVLEVLKAPSVTGAAAFRLATIGPTTEEYLRGNGHEVAVSSPEPDAESLAEAIYLAATRAL